MNINKVKDNLDKSLHDKSNPCEAAFDWIEKNTGIPRVYQFLVGVVFVGFYLVFGYGAQLLCNIIGVAYPAYISIHAIESSTKADDTKWLIYWVTFASLSLIEHFSVILINIIPFYWLLKCIFLIWCMLPIENNGSDVIYYRIVRPKFLKHHSTVDKFIDNTVDKTKSSISNILKTD